MRAALFLLVRNFFGQFRKIKMLGLRDRPEEAIHVFQYQKIKVLGI
jgi:hypothetical protein